MPELLPLTIDLRNCARCGKDHPALIFNPFTNKPDPITTHFAVCPAARQPILMHVLDPVKDGELMPKAHDVAALSAIIEGNGMHFEAHLFRLIAKASPTDRQRLAAGYPQHVQALEQWEQARQSFKPTLAEKGIR